MQKTDLILISPDNKILFKDSLDIYRINKKIIDSWEVAYLGNFIENKIERFLIKGGVKIGGDKLKEYALFNTYSSSKGTVSFNSINKNKWDNNNKYTSDEEYYQIEYVDNKLYITKDSYVEQVDMYSRINGEGLNATWINQSNEIIHTENNLTLKITFLGEKIFSKYMRLSLFSSNVLNNLDQYLYIKNGDKESRGWQFLTWYLDNYINRFFGYRGVFNNSRITDSSEYLNDEAYENVYDIMNGNL